MYNIVFRKGMANKLGSDSHECIEAIEIDSADIIKLMELKGSFMKRLYFNLLLKHHFKNGIPERFKILNNNPYNERVINGILNSWCLLNEDVMIRNRKMYQQLRDNYELDISGGIDETDSEMKLKEYFIESFDRYVEDEKTYGKTES